jgi:mono/diheme cytochrome c family protein
VVAIDPADPVLARGRHLVEAVGHCGDCHTPRNLAGGPDRSRWLSGGPAPEGDGRIPNITPDGDLGRWSPGEIAYFLETGFTPEFDVVGGAMAEVQRNMATLTPEDRAAIAAYLKAVPPVPADR